MADEPDAVFTPRGTHPLVESSVSLDVAHEDAPVSYAKGCRRAARKVFGALCFYYFCACCACCKAFDLPVRALLTIACFETLAVGGYVANMLVTAFGTEEDVDKAVYFVLATMSMLALTLWVFMLSAVRRENGYELAGADLMSSCLSVMPILLQFVQSERLSLESGAIASSLDGRGDDGASDSRRRRCGSTRRRRRRGASRSRSPPSPSASPSSSSRSVPLARPPSAHRPARRPPTGPALPSAPLPLPSPDSSRRLSSRLAPPHPPPARPPARPPALPLRRARAPPTLLRRTHAQRFVHREFGWRLFLLYGTDMKKKEMYRRSWRSGLCGSSTSCSARSRRWHTSPSCTSRR